MCRSIRKLHNLAPPATDDEVRAAALQFVRKLAGTRTPSAANREPFERAVDDIARAAADLLRSITAATPPRTREEEAERARARGRDRDGRAARSAG